ncbi:MAG: hypothetical protein CME06_17765 [Gemmatimonadetes bacterium]|nr:hypothetical protein [Gemmatimonadota bacterium]
MAHETHHPNLDPPQTGASQMFPHSAIRSILLSSAGLFALAGTARSADTVEIWDVGATDVDFYMGIDGLRDDRSDRAVFGDIMLGYGLTGQVSAYLGTTLEGDGYLSNGATGLYFGLFGTALDTDHFDFDLFLDISGDASGQLQFAPAVELNYDAKPDLASWGAYLRAGSPIYGRSEPETEQHDSAHHFETAFGSYWTATVNSQLLIEYDMVLHPNPAAGERDLEIGGLALGFNYYLGDESGIELINQIHFDLPQSGESFSVGVMVGMIASLPTLTP